MPPQPSPADVNRMLILAGPSMFLGKPRERNRRRILPDPAAKLLDPRTVGRHGAILTSIVGARRAPTIDRRPAQSSALGSLTVTFVVITPTMPLLSVTVSRTTKMFAEPKVCLTDWPVAVLFPDDGSPKSHS